MWIVPSRSTLARPRRPSRHVRRPRVMALLDECRAPVIVLVAPAGYGKTTAALEWVEHRRTAWYQASSDAADVRALAAGLARAAARIVPGAGARVLRRLPVADDPEDAAPLLADLLAEDLQAWPADAWLVIDDYQELASSVPCEELVGRLVELAPLRLLVTTRRRPRWTTARHLLHGTVADVLAEQLALTAEEAAAVLVGWPAEEVESVVERAEGWPVLIGLAAAAQRPAAPDGLASRELFRYFAEEVLRAVPAEIRSGMLAISLPARVDARLVRETLELRDGEATLQRLEDDGLLRDDGEGSLRFHPLLREFLRAQLESEDPERASGLRTRLVGAARAEGRLIEAYDLAL